MEKPEAITIGPITPIPSWKLYDNPFYFNNLQQQQFHYHSPSHRLPLPLLSARKLGASLWDLHPIPTFQTMDSDDVSRSQKRIKALEEQHLKTLSLVSSLQSQLDSAKSRINELKGLVQDVRGELETERKMRKKMESLNKKLSKDITEAKVVIAENLGEIEKERKNREVMEGVCDELAKEIASDKAELEEMKNECQRVKEEIEGERKMMRVAEIWREERVMMKLAEARLVMEERILDLERQRSEISNHGNVEMEKKIDCSNFREEDEGEKGCGGSVLGVGSGGRNSSSPVQSSSSHRKVTADAENPHIKRGIKGFVEFPRVVRAGGLRSKQLGSKVECQKAQLRLMMKQKNTVVGLNMAGTESLVIG